MTVISEGSAFAGDSADALRWCAARLRAASPDIAEAARAERARFVADDN